MTFGFALPFADLEGGPLRTGSLARNAQQVEAAGFSSIWAFDAMGRGFLLPDPLVALTAAAVATEQITIGTGILQLPLRSMADLASRVLAIAAEVDDRLLLGVGPGSTADDFALVGADYSARFETFERKLAELRSFLTTGAHEGRLLSPRTPSVAVSLGLAGWRGSMIERAASEHVAWIASGFHASDDELADGLSRYRNAGGARAVVTNVQLAEVDAGVERARRLHDLGFDDVVVMDPTPSTERLAALADRLELASVQ